MFTVWFGIAIKLVMPQNLELRKVSQIKPWLKPPVLTLLLRCRHATYQTTENGSAKAFDLEIGDPVWLDVLGMWIL